MTNRRSSGPRIIASVLAWAVKELMPILDASKTVDFKAILCCKSSVNLGWMTFLLMEKLNNNSLFMESEKMLNRHTHPRKMNDY
jgi:hypothetical protein